MKRGIWDLMGEFRALHRGQQDLDRELEKVQKMLASIEKCLAAIDEHTYQNLSLTRSLNDVLRQRPKKPAETSGKRTR